MRRLQADHDQKISHMTREYQDAEEVLEHKVGKLVEKEEEAERCHQRQLRDLEQDRQIQLQKMKDMSEKHHAAEDHHNEEIVEMNEELNSVKHYYEEKLHHLQQEHAAAMLVIHGSHQVEKLVMAEAHKKEMSTYETKMQSQMFKFLKNLDATLVRHEAEIHAIERGHYSEVTRLREDRRNFEEVQEKEHADRLSVMTAQHDAEKTVTVRNIRNMEEQHGLEVARMRQDRRDSERFHESEMSAMKAAHEKQLFKVHSLLAKECYQNGLVDSPRSPDSFPVQNEVEVENPSIRPRGNTTPSPPFETIHTPQQHPPLDMSHFPSEETPTVGRSQPPARENEDKVVAAMDNERLPDRRIHRRLIARTHGGDEGKAVEAMPDSSSVAPIPPPPAQDEAYTAPPWEKAKPIYRPTKGGTLSHKGPGLLKSLMFQKKYFWFGSEPVHRGLLASYLRSERDQRLAEWNADWSSRTGKGLLYFNEIPAKMWGGTKVPTGIFNLVCSNLAKHE
jgi:hypothetical protein